MQNPKYIVEDSAIIVKATKHMYLIEKTIWKKSPLLKIYK
jgi:hypothetical protein